MCLFQVDCQSAPVFRLLLWQKGKKQPVVSVQCVVSQLNHNARFSLSNALHSTVAQRLYCATDVTFKSFQALYTI